MESHLDDERRFDRLYSREEWARQECRSAIGYHVTMRLADDRGIARTPEALRIGSVVVIRHGRARGLVCHCFADTHLHALTTGSREEAGKLALYTEMMLRRRLQIPVPFQQCRIRPIEDERHLLHSVPYVYRQEKHHGTSFDLAHEGSNLPDLLGMRAGTGWMLDRLRAALPRLRRPKLLDWLGAPDLDDLEVNLDLVADASAAVHRVADLHGRTPEHARARRCATQFLQARAPAIDASTRLEIPRRGILQYLRQPVVGWEQRAIELQLKLFAHAARQREAVR